MPISTRSDPTALAVDEAALQAAPEGAATRACTYCSAAFVATALACPNRGASVGAR